MGSPLRVTVTILAQFEIASLSEEAYISLRDLYINDLEKSGLSITIESEDTPDGRWFEKQ